MSAERAHLRLVDADEAAPDPADEHVWRSGLARARAALDAGRRQPEDPGAGPEVATAGAFRPRLPAVEAAWRVVEGGREEGQR